MVIWGRVTAVAGETPTMPTTGGLLTHSVEELQSLHRLCREGRVYDVERWIKDGKPIQLAQCAVPKGRKPTSALRIALETGQHSLAFLMLRSGYRLGLEQYSPLEIALESSRRDLFELLLEWGADLKNVRPHAVVETYSAELYERYVAAGYDFTQGHAMASMLGYRTSNRPLYGFAKRHRAEDPRIQRELDMALVAHAREGNEKGISFCLWAGADPHAFVPDLRRLPRDDDRSMGWSAIEVAVHEGDLEMLRRFHPDPARDDFDGLYRTARAQHVVRHLATIHPPGNLTSILQFHLLFIAPGLFRSGEGTYALEAILTCGVRWEEPDSQVLSHIRRSLMKLDDGDFRKLLRLFGNPAICAPGTYAELTRTKPIQERMLALHIIWPRMSKAEKRTAAQRSLSCEYDRDKLYAQVWSEPAQRVAASYGFSGVRLGKICRILRVPVPPRGYWARLRSGQKMRRPRLPKLE